MHLPTLGINCLENSILKIAVVEIKVHFPLLLNYMWIILYNFSIEQYKYIKETISQILYHGKCRRKQVFFKWF